MKSTNSITKDNVLDPVFLVKTGNNNGLLTPKQIQQGNEVNMYYDALTALAKVLTKRNKNGISYLNLIINEHERFTEPRLYIAIKIVTSILALTKDLKVHIFDTSAAKRNNIL